MSSTATTTQDAPPKKKFADLTVRFLTAIFGAFVLIFCAAYGRWTYFGAFFLICFLSLREFYQLSIRDGFIVQKILGMVTGMSLFTLSFLIQCGVLSHHYYYLIFPLVSIIFLIKLYKKGEVKPFTSIAYTLLGIVYVVIPFVLLHIATFEHDEYNYQIIIGCLFILWATDSGAYFAGNLFGKRKLFARISPKKSWEGLIGGFVLAMIFAYGFSLYFTSLSLMQWLIIALIIVVCSTYGDLIESLMKRSMEIKDSGDALPGHGGFLDRFDGLFISAPFIVTFLELFQ